MLAAAVASAALAAPSVNLTWTGSGATPFRVLLSDGPELVGGPVRVRVNGRWYSSGDGSLTPESATRDGGNVRQVWRTAHGVPVVTTVSHVLPGGLDFTTEWPDGADGLSVGDADAVASEFPAIGLAGLVEDNWGFYGFHGNQLNYPLAGKVRSIADKRVQFTDDGKVQLANATVGGMAGGLVVLFDRNGSRSIVVSPSSAFMASNMDVAHSGPTIAMGVMGRASSVPPGFSTSFVLKYGSGIRPNLQSWGRWLRTRYNRSDDARRGDMTNSHLGYNTDNGAYYYYMTEPGKGYLQTLLDVHADAKSQGIPFKHVLLDSWWYFKDNNSAVTKWAPTPEIFPNGYADLDTLRDVTGWKFTMHNRFWSAKTVYAKQNGGDYNFKVEQQYSVPDDVSFWDYLLGLTKEHGLYTYEQDWLDKEYEILNETRTNVTLARTWLLDMGRGAASQGVFVQYCMPYPRHLLQSLEVPSVSQARASEDNIHVPVIPNNVWISANAIVIDSLGLAPLKDVFLSNAKEGPITKWNHDVELEYKLHSLSATLSTGPVTVGDRVGHLNKPLIMRSADAGGRLLRPSTPAFAMDRWFTGVAFSPLSPLEPLQATAAPYLMHAACRVPGAAADLVVGFHVARPVDVSPEDLHLDTQTPMFAVPLSIDAEVDGAKALAGMIAAAQPFDEAHPIRMGPALWPGFVYWQVVRADGGIVLLGEISKWVPLSTDRITSVADGLATVRGQPGESVTLAFAVADGAKLSNGASLSCTIGAGGAASFSLANKTCG